MGYAIVWKISAVKELSKIDKINSNKIYDKISEFIKNPYSRIQNN
jgi:mRNA-degrading endonuclease RelE of RelBE toxin-antitoxin system